MVQKKNDLKKPWAKCLHVITKAYNYGCTEKEEYYINNILWYFNYEGMGPFEYLGLKKT